MAIDVRPYVLCAMPETILFLFAVFTIHYDRLVSLYRAGTGVPHCSTAPGNLQAFSDLHAMPPVPPMIRVGVKCPPQRKFIEDLIHNVVTIVAAERHERTTFSRSMSDPNVLTVTLETAMSE